MVDLVADRGHRKWGHAVMGRSIGRYTGGIHRYFYGKKTEQKEGIVMDRSCGKSGAQEEEIIMDRSCGKSWAQKEGKVM